MKVFHFDGPTWAFLTPEQMYDEEGKLREAHRHYQNADIYFLTIMNKCLFDPSKTKVAFDGSVRCGVLVGDPVGRKFISKTFNFPLSEVLYAMPGIKDSFASRDDFLFFVLLRQYVPLNFFKKKFYLCAKKMYEVGLLSKLMTFNVLRAIYSSEIEVRHETRFEINIFDPVAKAITSNEKSYEQRKTNPRFYDLNETSWDVKKAGEVDYSKLPGAGKKENFRLTVDQVVNYFGIDVGNQRIAYIGKTEQKPYERLFPHVVLNELDAKLLKNEYETLVIHLFGFMRWDEPVSSMRPTTAISETDAITITEAELINYFKPEENDKYVKDDGKSEWKHIKQLLDKKYRYIRGLLDVDGQYAKFYTAHVGKDKLNRHEIDVDLNVYR